MSRNTSQRRVRRDSDPGIAALNPDEIWGKPLGFGPLYDASKPFEDRVERAWEHIKATRFMPEEHERLRAALAAKIKQELRNTSRIG